MMNLSARGVLLDIEGTTSSIQFVYEEMFPFVRRELTSFLCTNWQCPGLTGACDQIARDAGRKSLGDWCGAAATDHDAQEQISAEVIRLMDSDAKTTGLKMLQGMIWKRGFESGELKAHLFADVLPALDAWHRRGLAIRIYSSGSVQAQQLFFAHTIAGDVRPLFEAHYDTTTGPKRAAASYSAIAVDWGLSPGVILFLSDVPAELDAAREAGMQTVLCARPANVEVSGSSHPVITSFAELDITRPKA